MTRKKTPKPENGSDVDQDAPKFPLDPPIYTVSMSEDDLMETLRKLKGSKGLIADLAAKLGVSAQHLGNVLGGRASFGPKLLKSLGVVRVHRTYDVEVIMEDSGDERIA